MHKTAVILWKAHMSRESISVCVVVKIVLFVVQMNELTDSSLRFLARQALLHAFTFICFLLSIDSELVN